MFGTDIWRGRGGEWKWKTTPKVKDDFSIEVKMDILICANCLQFACWTRKMAHFIVVQSLFVWYDGYILKLLNLWSVKMNSVKCSILILPKHLNLEKVGESSLLILYFSDVDLSHCCSSDNRRNCCIQETCGQAAKRILTYKISSFYILGKLFI